MALKDIEKLIKDRLLEKITGLAVESFPENFGDYMTKFSHPVGVVLLAFKGAGYTADAALGITVQDKRLDFTATLIKRAPKNEDCYEHLDAIENALMGYKMPGCTKIYFTRSVFMANDFEKFIYTLDFSTTTKAVEVIEDSADPLLKKITLENNFGDTNVIPEGQI